MAKPPWARLTNPMRPMVTDRPTDTMNSTMPAATPPRSMLATSTPKITDARVRLFGGGRAWPDLLLLAGVLDPVDLADDFLVDAAVLHHRFGQVLVHDDVARDGVDHDGAARAREPPALERLERRVDLDLALERLGDVDDRRHAVVAADGHEVGGGVGAILLLPRLDEALVLRVVEIGVVVVHRDQADRGRAHRLELRILGDVARADQLDAGLPHAERRVGLHHGGRVVAGRDEHEEEIRLL